MERLSSTSAPPRGGLRSSDTPRFTLQLDDTKPHALRVEYRHNAKLFGAGLTMEWAPKPGLLEKDAVAIGRQADVVVAFVGLSPELEGEEMPLHIEGFSGGDRTEHQAARRLSSICWKR